MHGTRRKRSINPFGRPPIDHKRTSLKLTPLDFHDLFLGRLNMPTVWTFNGGPRDGQKVLHEPFIANWEKFNSNSGWNSGKGGWHAVMQALSHFSYHKSGGQVVLCDLQGGIYADGAILTDPVILSREKGRYGVTDLGPAGITSFFHQHKCNKYCRSSWTRPRVTKSVYTPVKGTTMDHIGTRKSKPYQTDLCVSALADLFEEDYGY
mmetsp:Transcript_13387/g.25575  ORF Transcript_13387/g.25575 Transcript_13387/m.25575 type:complete len:207 (-) Transcript_13387:272-892(-)